MKKAEGFLFVRSGELVYNTEKQEDKPEHECCLRPDRRRGAVLVHRAGRADSLSADLCAAPRGPDGKKVARQIDRAGVRPAAELWLLGDEEGRIRRKKPFLIEEETTVGRSRKCDLALRTPSLERVHGILTPVPEGLMLTAVGRAYLAINGREAAEGAVARDGDEIQLGGLHFELRLGESDAY